MRSWEKKAIRVGAVLFLVGVLLFAGAMASYGFNMNRFAREVSYNRVTYHPKGDFDRVDVSDVEANVRILPATDGACSVVCDETGRQSCIVEVEDGALTVRRENRWYDYIVNVSLVPQELTVYLPDEAYGRMQVESISGDIRIEGVGAEEIELGTVSGRIDLEGVELGALDAETTSGAVCMRDSIATGDVRIQTVSGAIRLDGSDAANLELETVSGGIQGELLRGKAFSARSVSGAVDVPESEAGLGRLSASTTSGDVKIDVRNP